MTARLFAAQALTPVIQKKASLSYIYEERLNLLADTDRGFYKELCFGVLRNYFSLTTLTKNLLQKPLKNKDADIQALILIGLYQLKYLRTPDHAAISETVNASKKLKKTWATKLINGVLRNYLRDQEKLNTKLSGNREAQFEHPAWMLDKWIQAWPDHWKEIVKAANTTPPITLRINAQKTTREHYQQVLADQDQLTTLSSHAESGLTLHKTADITSLPGFKDGLFTVQDEAAQLSAQLLDLAPQQRVLDACCAPGGKTSHIIERQPNLAAIHALDIDEARMGRVKENLARLNYSATLLTGDAAKLEMWWDGIKYNRILLDAPCSATGVIRRHPDIKLLRTPEDIASLAELQLTILTKLWDVLEDDGILLYATCSILPEENEQTIQKFVSAQDNALHLPIHADWGIERPFGRQLFPQQNGHDGFYYARLKKVSS